MLLNFLLSTYWICLVFQAVVINIWFRCGSWEEYQHVKVKMTDTERQMMWKAVLVRKIGLSRGGQLVASYNLSEYEIWPDKRRGHVWEGPYKSRTTVMKT
jgi:hypothetical protein